MIEGVQTFFSNSGPLSKFFSNYTPRYSQIEMSLMIEKLFQSKGFNIIEAETGIGKSFAYLVPSIYKVLKNKQRIVISTHTIALQEQLFYKDIPFLLEILNADIEVVLVKGMNNYLCLDKFHKLKSDPEYFKHPHVVDLDNKVSKPENNIIDSALSGLPKELSIKLSADPLNCLANACPHYKACHFYEARKPAQDASILIVNHHLLLTDLSIKNEGIQEGIIPSCHHLIIDEAHHIASIAEELFSHELSHSSLEGRLKPKILDESLQALIKPLNQCQESELAFFCETECYESIDNIIDNLKKAFEHAALLIQPNSNYALLDEQDQTLFEFFDDALFSIKNLENSLQHLIKTMKEHELQDRFKIPLFVADRLKNECAHIQDVLKAFETPKKDKLFFFEKSAYNSYFKCHYIHASKKLGQLFRDQFLSTTFCSATLSFDGKFENFKRECGLNEFSEIYENRFFSDFDYKNAMLFAIPSDMPEPLHPNYENELFKFCEQIIEVTKGGVFILFTSYDQLYKMAEKLKKSLLMSDISLFVQGTDSKQNLLDGFKSFDNSVLLGTDSFWEGVDVQGDKLRCVIITKLPFSSPNDPIFQATSKRLKDEKKDPFFENVLPDACIKFKQGMGRLIRSKDDFGVVICCDMRMINKGYGKYFLKTLPNCSKKLSCAKDIIKATEEKMSQNFQKTKG